jgi:hypothetical protein
LPPSKEYQEGMVLPAASARAYLSRSTASPVY